MNTNNQATNTDTAVAYYHNMIEGNFDAMADCLAEDILFISPLAHLSDKTAIVEAATNMTKMLSNIEIRAKLGVNNQVMLAYDFHFIPPIGALRAAVLMDFHQGLISRIELFFDARPFEMKKDDIFTKK